MPDWFGDEQRPLTISLADQPLAVEAQQMDMQHFGDAATVAAATNMFKR